MPTDRQYELADAKAAGKKLILIDTQTREQRKAGEVVHARDGQPGKLTSFDHRRVYVRWEGAQFDQGYFPHVFDCEVVIEGEEG